MRKFLISSLSFGSSGAMILACEVIAMEGSERTDLASIFSSSFSLFSSWF
jgi:hypothetical protein